MSFRSIIGTGKKELFEAFSPKFSSDKIFLFKNSDQKWFSNTLISDGPSGTFRLRFQHLPRDPADVNA